MIKLKDMVTDSNALAEGLKNNGKCHQNYKIYLPMERALSFLLSGNLYLSTGDRWNDLTDQALMDFKNVYARCFSCSTRENIAMWMLYSGNLGKNGAALNFLPSVMQDILHSKISLGRFEKGRFNPVYKDIESDKKNFDIFLSDVLYVDECFSKEKRDILKEKARHEDKDAVKITLGDEHVTVDNSIIDHEDICIKNISWSYERECRLVVRLKQRWCLKAKEEGLNTIQIRLSAESLRKMNKDRLIRSPIYQGLAEDGKDSELTGTVKWNL